MQNCVISCISMKGLSDVHDLLARQADLDITQQIILSLVQDINISLISLRPFQLWKWGPANDRPQLVK